MVLAQDCSSSQSSFERETSIELLRQQGVLISTAEAIVYDLLGTSLHPKFKEILGFNKLRDSVDLW